MDLRTRILNAYRNGEPIKGKCAICGAEVDDSYYCFGCGHFICEKHNGEPCGKHDYKEHQKEDWMFNWLLCLLRWSLCLLGRHTWSRWYAGQRHCKRCFLLETRPYKKREPRIKETIVSDGFGTECSVICPKCNNPSMVVVRPGDIRCTNCDN